MLTFDFRLLFDGGDGILEGMYFWYDFVFMFLFLLIFDGMVKVQYFFFGFLLVVANIINNLS